MFSYLIESWERHCQAGTNTTLHRWEPHSTVCQHPITMPLRCVGSQVHTHPIHDPHWQQKASLPPPSPGPCPLELEPRDGGKVGVMAGSLGGMRTQIRAPRGVRVDVWGGTAFIWTFGEIHQIPQAVQQSGSMNNLELWVPILPSPLNSFVSSGKIS